MPVDSRYRSGMRNNTHSANILRKSSTPPLLEEESLVALGVAAGAGAFYVGVGDFKARTHKPF